MQDKFLVIPSLMDGLHCIENGVNLEVERCSSRYEDEEVESHVSSDEGKVTNLIYYEEGSCEENDKSCCMSQEEGNCSTCSSSYEFEAN